MIEIFYIFKKIPAEVWVGGIAALLTAGFTLIGVWITNKANNQRLKIQLEHEQKVKNDEMYRDKLEELYLLSNKYLDKLVVHYLPYRMVMKGDISFNKALDIVIDNSSNWDFEPHRARMLIDLYHPQLKIEFDRILNIRERLNEIVDGYKEQYKQGDIDGARWLHLFQPLFEQLGTLADDFPRHIANLLK